MADFVGGGGSPASGVFASGINASGQIAGPSGVFTSGLDSSALIQGDASALIKSGLEASATMKGTIGNFLASVLAASGLNASGPAQATSGNFQSGVNASAAIQGPSYVVTSVVIASGPVQGTSGLFQSGVTASGLMSGPSAIFSAITLSALAQFVSMTVQSQLQVSGPASMFATLYVQSGIVSSAANQGVGIASIHSVYTVPILVGQANGFAGSATMAYYLSLGSSVQSAGGAFTGFSQFQVGTTIITVNPGAAAPGFWIPSLTSGFIANVVLEIQFIASTTGEASTIGLLAAINMASGANMLISGSVASMVFPSQVFSGGTIFASGFAASWAAIGGLASFEIRIGKNTNSNNNIAVWIPRAILHVQTSA